MERPLNSYLPTALKTRVTRKSNAAETTPFAVGCTQHPEPQATISRDAYFHVTFVFDPKLPFRTADLCRFSCLGEWLISRFLTCLMRKRAHSGCNKATRQPCDWLQLAELRLQCLCTYETKFLAYPDYTDASVKIRYGTMTPPRTRPTQQTFLIEQEQIAPQIRAAKEPWHLWRAASQDDAIEKSARPDDSIIVLRSTIPPLRRAFRDGLIATLKPRRQLVLSMLINLSAYLARGANPLSSYGQPWWIRKVREIGATSL